MDAKKSKYYDAALANCERALDCYLRAGLAAEWEQTVRQERAAHFRKATGSVELVVLSLKQKAARCRLASSGGEITLRATSLWDMVPGEIAVVRPHKQWTYAGNPYLSGRIESTRLDVGALELILLKLEVRSVRDPAQEYWCEEGEPIDEWATPIIARGRRPQFDMEQVLPGMDLDDPDPDGDPIG